jgi:glycosyltransferase involved in cell wall biosynthesis
MNGTAFDVSVVVPTFNREAVIGETLSAILSQTLPPREVIVVDDGSTDSTEAFTRRFPVRYVRQPNAGQNAARSHGAGVATGDWIGFCDDDDVWRPTFLATMAERLPRDGRYGFADFVFIENGIWGTRGKFADAPSGFFDSADRPLYSKLLDWVPMLPSSSIIRMGYFHAVGGFDLR